MSLKKTYTGIEYISYDGSTFNLINVMVQLLLSSHFINVNRPNSLKSYEKKRAIAVFTYRSNTVTNPKDLKGAESISDCENSLLSSGWSTDARKRRAEG